MDRAVEALALRGGSSSKAAASRSRLGLRWLGRIRVSGLSDPWACPLAALCLLTSAQSGEGEVPFGSKTSKPRVRDAIVGQVLRRQGL